jgi:hypothetical protein
MGPLALMGGRMTVTSLVLVGVVLAPGPVLDYDPEGLPRGRFTLRLDDSGLAVVVETWGEHAKWTAGRLHPGDRVLVVGARQPASASPMVVAAHQVVKLTAAAVSALAR